jgi:hypothetical protein
MNFPATYHAWILGIAETAEVPDQLLHTHAGLAVLLIAWFVSRRPLASFVPFTAVVAAEGANELMDYLHAGRVASDTVSDVAYTLFWPLVLSACARTRRLRVT